MQPEPHKSNEPPQGATDEVRRAGPIGKVLLLSRLLGLFRDMALTAMLGSTATAEALRAALRIPVMLRDMISEGTLSASFSPAYREQQQSQNPEAALLFSRAALSSLLLLLGITLTLLAWNAEAVMTLIFPGLVLHEEAVDNFRRLLPYLALVPLMAVLKGTLHCHRKDASALFPQALQNAALILAGLFLIWTQAGEPERAQGWTMAFLAGAGVSLLWLIIQLLKVSRFPWPTFNWKVPGQRRFLLDFGTLLVSQILLQAYSLLAFHLASELPTGSITWLETAFRFHFFPVALVGVSLGIVAGDESADLASRGEHQRLAQMLTRNQRLAAFLGFLAGAGLLATSNSIIDTLFVRGEFSPEDGLNTANILWWYCFAVPFACMNIGLQRTAIAIGLRKKVMLISLVGLGLQLGILFSQILPMDTGTIALAYVASTILSWIFLKWILHKNLELPRPRIVAGLKLLILGIMVQQTASYSIHYLDEYLPQFLGRDLSILGFSIVTGIFLALVVGQRLRMKEAHDMWIVIKSWTVKRSDQAR